MDEWVPLLVNCPKSVSEGIDCLYVWWGWEGGDDIAVFLVTLNTPLSVSSPLFPPIFYYSNLTNDLRFRKIKVFLFNHEKNLIG